MKSGGKPVQCWRLEAPEPEPELALALELALELEPLLLHLLLQQLPRQQHCQVRPSHPLRSTRLPFTGDSTLQNPA